VKLLVVNPLLCKNSGELRTRHSLRRYKNKRNTWIKTPERLKREIVYVCRGFAGLVENILNEQNRYHILFKITAKKKTETTTELVEKEREESKTHLHKNPGVGGNPDKFNNNNKDVNPLVAGCVLRGAVKGRKNRKPKLMRYNNQYTNQGPDVTHKTDRAELCEIEE